MKLTKRTRLFAEKTPASSSSIDECIKLLKETKQSKFNENVDIVVKLGIDPKKTDQSIRGTCNLPHGTGKKIRVLVFAKGEKEKEASDAGADFVGGSDLSEKVKGGWLDFERVVATPDMMVEVGKIGKILGPRGLMPNPKVGTVTMDVGKVVGDIKKGQIQFKNDKGANVHVSVGKIDFDDIKIKENIVAVLDVVNKLKPSTSKGTYIKELILSSTMGPGLKVNTTDLL